MSVDKTCRRLCAVLRVKQTLVLCCALPCLALLRLLFLSRALIFSLSPLSRSRPRSLSLPICMRTASHRFSMNDNTITLQQQRRSFVRSSLLYYHCRRSNAFLFPLLPLVSFVCLLLSTIEGLTSLFQVVRCVPSYFFLFLDVRAHSSIDRLDDVR